MHTRTLGGSSLHASIIQPSPHVVQSSSPLMFDCLIRTGNSDHVESATSGQIFSKFQRPTVSTCRRRFARVAAVTEHGGRPPTVDSTICRHLLEHAESSFGKVVMRRNAAPRRAVLRSVGRDTQLHRWSDHQLCVDLLSWPWRYGLAVVSHREAVCSLSTQKHRIKIV